MGFEGRPVRGYAGIELLSSVRPCSTCGVRIRRKAPGWRARAVPHVAVAGCQPRPHAARDGIIAAAPATPPPQSPDRRCRISRSARPRQFDLDHAGGLYSSQLRARVTGLNTVAAGAISTTMKASSPCRSPSCSRWGLERHHTDGRERGLDGRREMIPRGRHRRWLGSDHSRMPSHSRTC